MAKIKYRELPPIKESSEDFDKLEKALRDLWRKELYIPLLKTLGYNSRVLNSKSPLKDALMSGRITFYRGQFSGRFSAAISKELRSEGARWDKRTRTYRLPMSSLSQDLRLAIGASESRFRAKIADLDKKLTQILPAELASKLAAAKFFDTALFKVSKEFETNVKNIAITPKLTDEQRLRIAEEWQTNMQKYIKDWTETEIVKLREQVQAATFKGDRYEALVKTIQKSYGVSQNKAKFLARQETNLLMAKFKETKYQEAGIFEYKWKCVAGSKNHPVRPWHKALENKIYRWDDPPITTKPGGPIRKNNPGEDFNCRCFAIPVYKTGK